MKDLDIDVKLKQIGFPDSLLVLNKMKNKRLNSHLQDNYSLILSLALFNPVMTLTKIEIHVKFEFYLCLILM